MGQCRIHWLFQALSASHYKQRLCLNIQRQSAIWNPFSLSPNKCPQKMLLEYNLEKNFVVTVTNNIHNLTVVAYRVSCGEQASCESEEIADVDKSPLLQKQFYTFVKKSGRTCVVLSCSNNSGKLQLWRKLNTKCTSLYNFITVCWGPRGSPEVDQEYYRYYRWNLEMQGFFSPGKWVGCSSEGLTYSDTHKT